ncbi:hypothetical protein [Streptomyces aurantiacus]|uniref:hypothetical protein n=1 Tax=Streptomyces aurantiacus TaxID=47760 RepID=UPI000D14EE90|nr:hypothetical protein [Streptomyces aurantiacus]
MNRKRIARVMRERDIRGVTRRRRRSPTRPDKKATPAPDLIGRNFHAERPGTKLVGDITYLPTAAGWLYLACRLDLATPEVVGHAMADHHRASSSSTPSTWPTAEAVRSPAAWSTVIAAAGAPRLNSGPVYGSWGHGAAAGGPDHASATPPQRASELYSREEIGTRIWPDRAAARAEVFAFIETFYNRRRLRKHKTFGYLTPAETRQRHRHALAA